ncbi:VWA domain-containing protein [Polyangium sp. 15x6]|uniref:vWA domain-containing protein n=1 Tax=Polyangium sp. 15x6 TaxID=3042687 RepID=UPI00249A34C9|nr:VWA domain-containing protein [Polyangium sp. 15x6]MDI3282958.1 VWA domain-containing protein [Polyangium sp. 15x6]
MKSSRVAVLAFAGMLLTSLSVYSFTPPGGLPSSPEPTIGAEAIEEDSTTEKTTDATNQVELAHFTAGSTVMIDGRMGHPKILKNPRGETFLMLEARANADERAKAAAQVNLSIVIDRSGSMKGTRLRNAINAAIGAVERLHDGDMVSVVTFDTRTEVVVPAVVIGPSTRSSVVSSISGITLGGDTCISCGIETGMAEMSRASDGRISRMIVLSDGDANHGLKDVPGFRSLAQRARDRAIGISTVGVDVDYNEKILSAIAVESNGRHYFVENDAALARVFEGEAEALTQAVASGAEVDIDLAPGVELDRVFDRSFRRSGNRITVPLGTFSGGDVKTVLVKLRVPAGSNGELSVATVDMRYKDLVKNEDGRCSGKLGVEVVDANASDLDAVVAGRVNRSETASALEEANRLFEQGKVAEARRRIESREQALRDSAAKAKTSAPATRAADVAQDFDRQLAVVQQAQSGFAAAPVAAAAAEPAAGPFATPPPAAAPIAPTETRQGRKAVRSNQEAATNMGF